jgi:hypothetical protein
MERGYDSCEMSGVTAPASVLTWDFRHFRAVVLRRGHHWPLVVDEGVLQAAPARSLD